MSFTGGDIAQTYALLQKIYDLMQQVENQSQKTEDQVVRTTSKIVTLRLTLQRTLVVVRRISGNEDLNKAIDLAQKAIMTYQQLYLVSTLISAGSPAGLVLAGIGVVGMAITFTDSMAGY